MTKPKKPDRHAVQEEREVLTAALLDFLVLPGIKDACRILRAEMKESDTSGNAARVIIKVAQDLVQKGFPEPTAEDRAAKIRKELDTLAEHSSEESGGGETSPDPSPAPVHLGEDGSKAGLLPGEGDL